MSLRFIHSADWQIRKVFRFVDDETMGLLQNARLDAITRLGELAREHAAAFVVVAGDVYDLEALSERSLLQPIERMRAFPELRWFLLPGNHDPQRPYGLWDRLAGSALPDNVIPLTRPEVWLAPDERFAILPAPLAFRSTETDPTAAMDSMQTPTGCFRIGLAHGSITRFGADDAPLANYIDPTRPEKAQLDYLALGDWHGQKCISQRVWYAGTHETDAFDVDGGGQALLVTLTEPGATPVVAPLRCGRYHWFRDTVQLHSRADIDALEERLRALPDTLAGEQAGQRPVSLTDCLGYLTVEGTLSLTDFEHFDTRISQALGAALAALRLDTQALYPQPSDEDLRQIEDTGFVRQAADQLATQAADVDNPQREIAALALQRLYLEHRKLAGTAR